MLWLIMVGGVFSCLLENTCCMLLFCSLIIIILFNRYYADQHFQANTDIPQKSRLHAWKKKIHNVTELLQFIAVMGIIHYWVNHGLSAQMPFHG